MRPVVGVPLTVSLMGATVSMVATTELEAAAFLTLSEERVAVLAATTKVMASPDVKEVAAVATTVKVTTRPFAEDVPRPAW